MNIINLCSDHAQLYVDQTGQLVHALDLSKIIVATRPKIAILHLVPHPCCKLKLTSQTHLLTHCLLFLTDVHCLLMPLRDKKVREPSSPATRTWSKGNGGRLRIGGNGEPETPRTQRKRHETRSSRQNVLNHLWKCRTLTVRRKS